MKRYSIAENLNAQDPAGTSYPDAEALVDQVSGLVSPPGTCMQVLKLIRSPNASADSIAEAVSCDPNLTARVLKLVNSSFFGFASRIDTVTRAIALIGMLELYNLVVTVSVVRSFSNVASTLVNMDTFWRHSIYSALLARTLAQNCHILHPERVFVAGLLHDLGSLVLYNQLPDISHLLLMQAEGDEQDLFRLEEELLGFSHAHVGALIMRTWSFPEALCEAIENHHRPCKATDAKLETALLHTAEILANRSEIGAFCESPNSRAEIDPMVYEEMGLTLTAQDEDELIGSASLEFAETVSILGVGR